MTPPTFDAVLTPVANAVTAAGADTAIDTTARASLVAVADAVTAQGGTGAAVVRAVAATLARVTGSVATGGGTGAAVVRAVAARFACRASAVTAQRNGDHPNRVDHIHREARAVAALRSRNIVQIHDYSGPDEPVAYLVMELIEGGDLDHAILRYHPLPEPVILSIAYGIACGVRDAHATGVIHRDIKPANVLVENGGRVIDGGRASARNTAQNIFLGLFSTSVAAGIADAFLFP